MDNASYVKINFLKFQVNFLNSNFKLCFLVLQK